VDRKPHLLEGQPDDTPDSGERGELASPDDTLDSGERGELASPDDTLDSGERGELAHAEVARQPDVGSWRKRQVGSASGAGQPGHVPTKLARSCLKDGSWRFDEEHDARESRG
jgi:hypothetical protein